MLKSHFGVFFKHNGHSLVLKDESQIFELTVLALAWIKKNKKKIMKVQKLPLPATSENEAISLFFWKALVLVWFQ